MPSRSKRPRVFALATEMGSAKAMVPVLSYLADRGAILKAMLPRDAAAWAASIQTKGASAEFVALRGNVTPERVMEKFAPDVVLIGTTALESPDRRSLRRARRIGVPTVSIVDERYGFRRRFSDEKSELVHLTDKILVMDEECRHSAIQEGLPGDRLTVTGSPMLSYLVFQQSKVTKSGGRTSGTRARRVVFVSETFARDNGRSVAQRGKLEGFMGYTEDTVRQDIVQAMDPAWRVEIIECLHPSATQKPKRWRATQHVTMRQVRGGALWPLVLQSDAVIGMRSMALLETGLLGCRTASYQPGLIGENQCAAVHCGVAAALSTPEALNAWLRQSFEKPLGRTPRRTDLPFVRSDAIKTSARIVLETIKHA